MSELLQKFLAEEAERNQALKERAMDFLRTKGAEEIDRAAVVIDAHILQKEAANRSAYQRLQRELTLVLESMSTLDAEYSALQAQRDNEVWALNELQAISDLSNSINEVEEVVTHAASIASEYLEMVLEKKEEKKEEPKPVAPTPKKAEVKFIPYHKRPKEVHLKALTAKLGGEKHKNKKPQQKDKNGFPVLPSKK